MGEKRFALIVASSRYEDPDLKQLAAPSQDAKALENILEDAAIGGFEVKTLLNEPSYRVNKEIESFFTDRERDDLLLLYVSCHGIKDLNGILYFATSDTNRKLLRATSISANFVNEVMSESNSRRQVLLLDCCFSGAFARGMKSGDKDIHSNEQFQGRGRAVMTASDAIQYSFEGDKVEEVDIVRSFFTNALVQGLENGEADFDRDGRISFDELYDYVFRYVKEKTPKQTPRKWALGVEGDIFIARTPSKLLKDSKSPTRESLVKLLEAGEIEEFNRLRNETEIALKLRKTDLSARVLIDADLAGADLREAKLVKTKLTCAILKGANLEGADLREAKLIDADLYGANLSRANLTGASLRGANLRGMVDFSGSNLTDADLRGVDLAGMVNFANAILINTDFTGATTDKALIDFRGAKAENVIGIQIPSDDNEYLKDLKSFSEDLKEQFRNQNIPTDNIKPIEESVKELTAEVKDIPAKEEVSSEKRENVNTKLIDVAQKVTEHLPQTPETLSSFGALSSFNKITEKKVEQIAENMQKQVIDNTGSKSPIANKQIDKPSFDQMRDNFANKETSKTSHEVGPLGTLSNILNPLKVLNHLKDKETAKSTSVGTFRRDEITLSSGSPVGSHSGITNWNVIIGKNVRSTSMEDIGRVIGTTGEDISIIGSYNRTYNVPKSNVELFNGSEVLISISAREMNYYDKTSEARRYNNKDIDLYNLVKSVQEHLDRSGFKTKLFDDHVNDELRFHLQAIKSGTLRTITTRRQRGDIIIKGTSNNFAINVIVGESPFDAAEKMQHFVLGGGFEKSLWVYIEDRIELLNKSAI